MSANQHLLGIDLGTSSVKVVITAATGRVLASGSAEYPILRPYAGYAEQDPEQWWDAICRAVRSALDESGDDVDVASIGLSGQMHGTVLVGADGRPLAPAVIWPDQRSVNQVDEITRKFGLERLTEITGSPVATGFQAATLLWVRQEQPALWRRIEKVLLPKDYVRWRMTGVYATDPSDGSGALMLDVQERDWSAEILDVLALDSAQLPLVQPASAEAGGLTAQAAADLSLSRGTPVVTGAADTACSALGAGVAESGKLLLTLSSGGQLVQPAGEANIDVQGRIHTFCSALEPEEGPAWYQMGAILSAGLALRWLRDDVFRLGGEDAYERISAWAGEVEPGAEGLLFLPYLAGERTPHMDPLARGLFLGLTAQHGRAHLARAVMEGVALACYDAYAVLHALGASPDAVILAGGGAGSGVWRQIVADVFGLHVQPLAVAEQSAAGAAILAGAGSGWFDAAHAARKWANYGSVVTPDAERHHRYLELFELFRAAYVENSELFRKLSSWAQP